MSNIAGQDWFSKPSLQRILALLNGDGGEARIVGGAVRNALMGMPVGDIDIATTLPPQDVVERAKQAGIKAVPTGFEHGTVTLVLDGEGSEVTTLRRDVETNGRHAQVVFGTDWQEDAERRDLTINALYADASGEVIDLIGGLSDIEKRNVRFIGDADKRIAEIICASCASSAFSRITGLVARMPMVCGPARAPRTNSPRCRLNVSGVK